MNTPHVVERCAQFAAQFQAAPIPPVVLHHAKRAVIDWYAALFPGAIEAPATLLEKALAGDLDRGGATLALGRSATARTAALINGAAAHTVEFDDIFRRRRLPSSPTVYVCAEDRCSAAIQPQQGHERLFCLINAPPIGDTHLFESAEIKACESRVFQTLANCGLTVHAQADATMATTPSPNVFGAAPE